MKPGEDRLDALERMFVIRSLSLHPRHQEFDNHVIESANAAVVHSVTERDDDVTRVCTRIVDDSQTVNACIRERRHPSIKSLGYESSIGNHINAAASRNGAAQTYLLQVILNKNIVLNAT